MRRGRENRITRIGLFFMERAAGVRAERGPSRGELHQQDGQRRLSVCRPQRWEQLSRQRFSSGARDQNFTVLSELPDTRFSPSASRTNFNRLTLPL